MPASWVTQNLVCALNSQLLKDDAAESDDPAQTCKLIRKPGLVRRVGLP